MIRGLTLLRQTQSLAYKLYITDNPIPEWLKRPRLDPQDTEFNDELFTAEKIIETAQKMDRLGSHTGASSSEGAETENIDLIDLEMHSCVIFLLFIMFLLLRRTISFPSNF
jgi:hypothetical protein